MIDITTTANGCPETEARHWAPSLRRYFAFAEAQVASQMYVLRHYPNFCLPGIVSGIRKVEKLAETIFGMCIRGIDPGQYAGPRECTTLLC